MIIARDCVQWLLKEILWLSLSQEVALHQRDKDDSTLSALDEDDFQTVVIENKLGCDIYVKKLEQNSDTVELLQDNGSTAVWLPPPRFSDRLNVTDKNGEARYYVAVRVSEAKVLQARKFTSFRF